MKLKNYQEDIVLRAIDIALEGQPELLCDDDLVNDVAAYVLNRVPPRYVMSERGFLRLALEHLEEEREQESLANVIELMLLVNRGLALVQSRRSGGPRERRNGASPARASGFGEALAPEFVHNYPQFIGRVVDDASDVPVRDATVSLFIDGDLVSPAAGGWVNPYVTREATRGYFSFWPRATVSEQTELASELLFTVTHPQYAPYRHVRRLVTSGDFAPAEIIQGDGVVSLGAFRLVAGPSEASDEG